MSREYSLSERMYENQLGLEAAIMELTYKQKSKDSRTLLRTFAACYEILERMPDTSSKG